MADNEKQISKLSSAFKKLINWLGIARQKNQASAEAMKQNAEATNLLKQTVKTLNDSLDNLDVSLKVISDSQKKALAQWQKFKDAVAATKKTLQASTSILGRFKAGLVGIGQSIKSGISQRMTQMTTAVDKARQSFKRFTDVGPVFDKLKNKLSSASKSIERLSKKQIRLKDVYKKTTSALQSMWQSTKNALTIQVDLEDSTSSLQASSATLSDKFKQVVESSKAMNKLLVEIHKIFEKIANQKDATKSQREGAKKTISVFHALWNAVKQTSGAIKNAYGHFKTFKDKLGEIDKTLGISKTIGGIKNLFQSAVSEAAILEVQFDNIRAITGATDAEMAKIVKTLEAIGTRGEFSTTQAAQGFELLSQAGLSVKEALYTLPEVLTLSKISGLALSETVDTLTKVLTTMNLPISQTGRVMDMLAEGAVQAGGNVKGFSEALQLVLPAAASAGLPLERIIAMIGQFVRSGLSAKDAGNAFNQVLTEFETPASAFKQALAGIGITTNDFDKALSQLASSGAKGDAVFQSLGNTAGPALKGLLAQGLPALNQLSGQISHAKGSAQSMADTMQGNLTGALSTLGNVWTSLKSTLGKPLLAPIAKQVNKLAALLRELIADGSIAEFGEKLGKSFTDISNRVFEFVSNFDLSDVVKKAGDTATVIGKVISELIDLFGAAMKDFRKTYNLFSTGINTIKAIIFGAGAAVAYAVSKIREGIVGIVSLIPGMGDVAESLRIHTEGVKGVAIELGKAAVESFNKAGDAANRFNADLMGVTYGQKALKDATAELADETQKAVDLFNQKSEQLQALKQKEAEYAAGELKNSREHNKIIRERINLETELNAITEGKVLENYVLEQEKSNKATEKSSKTTKKYTKNIREAGKATRQATQSTQAHQKATQENADTSSDAADIAKHMADTIGAVRQKYKDSQAAVKAFNLALEGSLVYGMSIPMAYQAIERAAGIAAKKYEEFKETLAASKKITQSLNKDLEKNTLSLSQVEEAAKFARGSITHLNKAQLKDLNATIDKAKQKIKDLEKQAKETAENIAEELADKTDTEVEKINRQFDKRKKKLEEARDKAISREAKAKYEQALRDLEKLRQIALAEQKDRDDKAAENEKRRSDNVADAVKKRVKGTGSNTVSAFDFNANTIVDGLVGVVKSEINQAVPAIQKKVSTAIEQELHNHRKKQGY